MQPNEILDLPMSTNDAGASTVREYLKILVYKVWGEEEQFSGKRPFGVTGWQNEVYRSLYRAGLIEGTEDGEGWISNLDREAGDALILNAILTSL